MLFLPPGYSFPENMDFFYNDRFEMVFGGTFDPKPRNKLLAIEQGLPNPMIVVAEYMDTFGGGFRWGLAIPAAGYYGKSKSNPTSMYDVHTKWIMLSDSSGQSQNFAG